MDSWMIAANPKYYDHEKAFREQSYVDWRQTRNFKVGDTVYIYCAKPVSQVKYKTIVEQTGLEPYVDKYWRIDIDESRIGPKLMRLRIIAAIDSDELRFINLKHNGMPYPPQSPCRLKPDLLEYFERFFSGDQL